MRAMALVLYDLAGADPNRRFSPYCWRAKLCLAHKKLAFETVPWRFTETEALAFSGQGAVPVLRDGEKVISNSWDIANYLESTYPERPTLFGGDAARTAASFLTEWVERMVQPPLAPLVSLDIWKQLGPRDQEYYRRTRELRYGATLEAVAASSAEPLARFQAVIAPLRAVLAEQPFLGGASPMYPDYAAFGPFAWARAASPIRIIEAGDPVDAWRTRMLEVHGGLVRGSPGFD